MSALRPLEARHPRQHSRHELVRGDVGEAGAREVAAALGHRMGEPGRAGERLVEPPQRGVDGARARGRRGRSLQRCAFSFGESIRAAPAVE